MSKLITITVVALAVLLLLASIAQIVATALTHHRYEQGQKLDVQNENDFITLSNTTSEALLPPYVPSATAYFKNFWSEQLALGILGLINAIVILVAIITTGIGKAAHHAGRSGSDACLGVATGFGFLVSFAIFGLLGYVFHAINTASPIDFQYEPPAPGQSSGWEFSWSDDTTWPTYICLLGQYFAAYDEGKWASTTCSYTKVAKWTMIPVAILSLLTSLALAVLWYTRPSRPAASKDVKMEQLS